MADLKSEWEKATPVGEDISKAWDEAKPEERTNIYSKAKLYFSAHGKPMMEMGGAAAGGIAGSAVGPIGSVAGAGLGYGIAKKVAEIIESGLGKMAGEEQQPKSVGQELLGSAEDVATGATYEMGGQLFMPLLRGGKYIFQQGKSLLSREMNERIVGKAAEKWIANTSQGPIYAKNAKEATDLEMSIPGLKFTYGQKTYDPNAIRLERAQIRKPGGAEEVNAAQMSAEQIASNDEALKAYYQSNFGSKAGVDDLLSALQGKQQNFEQGVEGAQKAASAVEAGTAQKAREASETGTRLLNVLKTEKQHTSKAIGRLYDKIPDVDVPVTGMIDELKNIAKPLSEVESKENFPNVLKRAIKAYGPDEMPEQLQTIVDSYAKAGQPLPAAIEKEVAKYGVSDTLKFKELRGLRTEILNEMRSEAAKNNPAKMKRLGEMQRVVEGTIDQLKDAGKFGEDAATSYRVASKAWKDYSDTFKRGTVGNILQGGAKGEVSKMNPEKIVSSIFDAKNLSAADQLTKAVGQEQATPLVKEYAAYDLMRKSVNPMTGEVDRGKLMGWLSRNGSVLKKYGLEGEFTDLAQAKALVDETTKVKVAFQKSQAAKVLDADPEKIIEKMFSGQGATNSAQTAKDILELVSGNQAATEGVKQAFADFAVNKVQTSLRDIVGNPAASVAKFDSLYQKFAPAMRVLYADNPEKIKTLMDMKKAYEIMIRNQRSPFGGGSDTAENMVQMLSNFASPLARTSRTATALKHIAGKIARYEGELVDKVINKAIFDPEYAETLKMLGSTSGKLQALGEKRFGEHIAAATGVGVANIMSEEQ
jgi:hypothetical protein